MIRSLAVSTLLLFAACSSGGTTTTGTTTGTVGATSSAGTSTTGSPSTGTSSGPSTGSSSGTATGTTSAASSTGTASGATGTGSTTGGGAQVYTVLGGDAGVPSGWAGPAFALAIDSVGNLYFADFADQTIQVVTPGTQTGQPFTAVSTYAGSQFSQGFVDGPAASAQFNGPTGLAFDSHGNLYVVDSKNDAIREVLNTNTGSGAPVAGNVVTIAGAGPQGVGAGFADGTGGPASSPGTARFGFPYAIAVDANDNLFIADGNPAIREWVAATSRIVTLTSAVCDAGTCNGIGGYQDGPLSSALLRGALGLALDPAGNLYFSDYNNVVRKITYGGSGVGYTSVSTIAGLEDAGGLVNGPPGVGTFGGQPTGVALADGGLYVCDRDNYAVRFVSLATGSLGMLSTVAGNGAMGDADGPALSASFGNPIGLAVSAAGDVFVADQGNSEIREIVP